MIAQNENCSTTGGIKTTVSRVLTAQSCTPVAMVTLRERPCRNDLVPGLVI